MPLLMVPAGPMTQRARGWSQAVPLTRRRQVDYCRVAAALCPARPAMTPAG
jgi:hypothetical protein